MYALAHITDPHLGPLPPVRPLELANKRILGYLSWTRRRAKIHRPEVLEALGRDLAEQAPDHVAVTGDLTNISLPGEFQRAAGMRPGVSGPWWALGFVRLELGLPRAAGEALRSAHALGERDPELLVLLARVARLEGDVETAVESYAQALARDPSADADRLVEAATMFLEDELNDPTRRWVALAVGWLDRAEDVHPGDGRLSDVRALILARHGP